MTDVYERARFVIEGLGFTLGEATRVIAALTEEGVLCPEDSMPGSPAGLELSRRAQQIAGLERELAAMPVTLPGDVRELLTGLAAGKTVDQARAEESAWRDSADLNEGYLAGITLRAAGLLAKYQLPPGAA
jgi:hypothetical protein